MPRTPNASNAARTKARRVYFGADGCPHVFKDFQRCDARSSRCRATDALRFRVIEVVTDLACYAQSFDDVHLTMRADVLGELVWDRWMIAALRPRRRGRPRKAPRHAASCPKIARTQPKGVRHETEFLTGRTNSEPVRRPGD